MTARATSVGAVGVVLALVGGAVGTGGGASADATDVKVLANRVTLRATVSTSISESATSAIINALYDSEAKPTFSNARLGDGLARQELISSVQDGKLSGSDSRYAISGVPFSAAEQAQLATAKVDLVEMPIHAVGLGVFVSGPALQSQGYGSLGFPIVTAQKNPDDDGSGFLPKYLFTDAPSDDLDGRSPTLPALQMKLPWRNLSSMLVGTAGGNDVGANGAPSAPFNSWYAPSLLTLWGYEWDPDVALWRKTGTTKYMNQFIQVSSPRPASRFEPTADNLYLQQVVVEKAPEAWNLAFATAAKPGPSETWQPFQPVLSRGLDQILPLLAQPDQPSSDPRGTPPPIMGTMAAMPTWGLQGALDAFPGKAQRFWVAELQNASGEWVSPTSDAITKAVAAGGTTPLHALHDPAPGAYPLTWVESLYAPSKGLSIDETNSLLAMVRFMATDGQDIMKRDGDGVLSPALVKQTLDAANKLATSSCTAAGGVPVTATASPYYPPATEAPKLAALAAQVVCGTKVAPPATTTTTTTVAPTTTSSSTTTSTSTSTSTTMAPVTFPASPSVTARRTTTPATTRPAPTAAPSVPAPTPTGAPPSTTRVPASTTTSTVAPAPQVLPAAISAKLPLGLPGDGTGGFDRVSTMLLGGVALLFGRSQLRRRRKPS